MSNISFADAMAAAEELDKQLECATSPEGAGGDSNEFKLTYNADGITTATLRLLPAGPAGGEFLYKYREHTHRAQGSKFTASTCPSAVGQPCNVCDAAWEQYRAGNKDNFKALIGNEMFLCWVYVVADPLNPSNVGKIMKYRYKRMISKMIEDKFTPKLQFEEKVNVFNLMKGANLVIKAAKVPGSNMPKFDGTYFADSSTLKPANGETLEQLWNRIPSLRDEIAKVPAPDATKLDFILSAVLGQASGHSSQPASPRNDMDNFANRSGSNVNSGGTTGNTGDLAGYAQHGSQQQQPVQSQADPVKTEPTTAGGDLDAYKDLLG